MSDEKDYLAYISIAGGGQWARGPDKQDAAERCARGAREDWGHIIEFEDRIKVGIYDVTGHDVVRMTDRGVIGDAADGYLSIIETIEV